jgi:hypothetical protein
VEAIGDGGDEGTMLQVAEAGDGGCGRWRRIKVLRGWTRWRQLLGVKGQRKRQREARRRR